MKTQLKSTPNCFASSQLCHSVALCEATRGDRYGWGNSTAEEPAFIVYLGCRKDEVESYVKSFNIFYRCAWEDTGGEFSSPPWAVRCEVRKPKHLKGFEAEIKVRRMQRYSDSYAFGLDYLVESEQAKHFGADMDEYQYYTACTQQYW